MATAAPSHSGSENPRGLHTDKSPSLYASRQISRNSKPAHRAIPDRYASRRPSAYTKPATFMRRGQASLQPRIQVISIQPCSPEAAVGSGWRTNHIGLVTRGRAGSRVIPDAPNRSKLHRIMVPIPVWESIGHSRVSRSRSQETVAYVLRSISKHKFTPEWNCRNFFLGNACVGALGNVVIIETEKRPKLQQEKIPQVRSVTNNVRSVYG